MGRLGNWTREAKPPEAPLRAAWAARRFKMTYNERCRCLYSIQVTKQPNCVSEVPPLPDEDKLWSVEQEEEAEPVTSSRWFDHECPPLLDICFQSLEHWKGYKHCICCCGANDSTYCYTFPRNVVCRRSSVCQSINQSLLICRLSHCLNRSSDLDAILPEHLWGLVTHCVGIYLSVRWGSLTPSGRGDFGVEPPPTKTCNCKLLLPPGE